MFQDKKKKKRLVLFLLLYNVFANLATHCSSPQIFRFAVAAYSLDSSHSYSPGATFACIETTKLAQTDTFLMLFLITFTTNIGDGTVVTLVQALLGKSIGPFTSGIKFWLV